MRREDEVVIGEVPASSSFIPNYNEVTHVMGCKGMAGEGLDRERIERVVQAMPALVGVVAASKAEPLDVKSTDEVSWKDLLADYFRVMEIAHYLRRGGVKAIIYRIQTGRAQLAPNDYFDDASQRLCEAFRRGELPVQTDQPVLERLAAVSAEEESVVRDYLPRIDEILLSEKRKEAALSEE